MVLVILIVNKALFLRLTSPDSDPNDGIGKLPANTDSIGFDGARVVEIHGVAANANLPDSVISADPNNSPEEELPIACGVLRRSGGATGGTGGTTGGTGGTTGGGPGCNGGKC